MKAINNNDNEAREYVQQVKRQMQQCRHNGPTEEEQTEAWFLGTARFLGRLPCPFEDLLRRKDSTVKGMHAATQRISQDLLLDNDIDLDAARSEPKSVRFVMSLAVDAWINRDEANVRSFLLKATFLKFLQHTGLSEIRQGLSSNNYKRYIEGMQRIIMAENGLDGLKAHLEFLSRSACLCIELAEVVIEDEALIWNPEDPLALAKKQKREINRLPPFLRPNSEVMKLKKKGATFMQSKSWKQSYKTYKRAMDIVDSKLEELARNPQHCETNQHVRLGSVEAGKIESNLSLVAFKKGDYQISLEHAEKAAAHAQAWSKPYSRKAVACEALGRHSEAHMAIEKAIEVCQKEILDDVKNAQQMMKEYQEIEQRISAELEGSGVPENEVILYRPIPPTDEMNIKVGTLKELVCEEAIIDEVLQYCTIQDFAHLQQTCRSFATTSTERRRRIVFSNSLYNDGSKKVNELVQDFCNKNLNDMESAVKKLVSSLHQCIPSTGTGSIQYWMAPLISNKSEVTLVQGYVYSASLPFLDIALDGSMLAWRWLLRNDNVSDEIKQHCIQKVDHDLREYEGDINPLYEKFFECGVDEELFRLATVLQSQMDQLLETDDEVDADRQMEVFSFQTCVFVGIQNILIAKQGQINNVSPAVVELTKSLNRIFNEFFCPDWPGESCRESLADISVDDIEFEWLEDPASYRKWKLGMQEALKWLATAKPHATFLLLLLQRGIISGLAERPPRGPIMSFTFCAFLLKRGMAHGGPLLLGKALNSTKACARFVADYYLYAVRLCCALDLAVAWGERQRAMDNAQAL